MIPVGRANRSVGVDAPADPSPGRGRRRLHRAGRAGDEIIAGALLVALTIAGGVYVAFRPGSGAFDRWIQSIVTRNQSAWFTTVTSLRYPAAVVVGALALAAIAVILRRDRPRALACLVGPPLALLTSELVVKPLVGRSIGGVLSYPSGSTVGAAALATAAVLAVPTRWRVATAVVVTVYALWMALAVVALQWHYPTDSLAGLAYGAGVVLMVDGSVGAAADRLGGAGSGRRLLKTRQEGRRPDDG